MQSGSRTAAARPGSSNPGTAARPATGSSAKSNVQPKRRQALGQAHVNVDSRKNADPSTRKSDSGLVFPGISRGDIRRTYVLGRELGSGGGGVVRECLDHITRQPVAACKTMQKSKLQVKDATRMPIHSPQRPGTPVIVQNRGLHGVSTF